MDGELAKYFVQSGIISARFILAMLIIVGFVFGYVDQMTAGLIIAFYFGSNSTSQILKKLEE
jgi:hypothetical protein